MSELKPYITKLSFTLSRLRKCGDDGAREFYYKELDNLIAGMRGRTMGDNAGRWICPTCQEEVSASQVSAQQQPTDNCGVSKVYRICNSYESGVGKGRDASKFKTGDHLADPEEREAYVIGYEFGERRRLAKAMEQTNE